MIMDVLVTSQDEAPDGTGYNDPPINLKEITEADFAKSQFHSYTFTHVEFRQMILKDDLSSGKLTNGKMVQAKLFWFSDDTGVAISADSWKGTVRYFAFGCNHKIEVKKLDTDVKLHCSKCNSDIREPWMDLIVSDSGWGMNEFSSRPSRGIMDYERTIRFRSPMSTEDMNKVLRFFRKNDCPGWTGVGMRDLGTGEDAGLLFRFNSTHDSSD
jgi:hypothetical protein